MQEVNASQKQILIPKITRDFSEDLSGHRFAIWGLAFKPNTDDIREASSLVLIRSLLEAGAKVRTHDPEAMGAMSSLLGADAITCVDDPMEALDGADALAIVTEWKTFRSPDFNRIKKSMKAPLIFDGRNLYDPETVANAGIEYHAIGRPPARAVE